MPKTGTLINTTQNQTLLSDVRWCTGFGCKFMGLMFRRKLGSGEGLVMVENKPSRTSTAIHMLFMFIPISVIWLDEQLTVVDKRVARPWRLAYVPAKPAQYTLEAHPDLLENVNVGDVFAFEPHEA